MCVCAGGKHLRHRIPEGGLRAHCAVVCVCVCVCVRARARAHARVCACTSGGRAVITGRALAQYYACARPRPRSRAPTFTPIRTPSHPTVTRLHTQPLYHPTHTPHTSTSTHAPAPLPYQHPHPSHTSVGCEGMCVPHPHPHAQTYTHTRRCGSSASCCRGPRCRRRGAPPTATPPPSSTRTTRTGDSDK